ncbi:MAG TPA: hypothetical protein VGM88_33600 [Kofleriaceae bacterium]
MAEWFRGRHLVRARGRRLELFAVDGDRLIRAGEGDAPTEVGFATVGAREPWVVGRDPRHQAVWSWTPSGAKILHEGRGAIGGVVELGGASYITLATRGQLALQGADRTVAIAYPNSWWTHALVPLGGDRIAILGNIADEPKDQLLVTTGEALLRGAMPTEPADEAIKLIVGRAPGDAMVVVRDPDGEEDPVDPRDADEVPAVWGFTGAYIGAERAPWSLPFAKLAAVCATDRVIAVQLADGVAIRERATGAVQQIAGAILDPETPRLAIPDGDTWTLRSL